MTRSQLTKRLVEAEDYAWEWGPPPPYKELMRWWTATAPRSGAVRTPDEAHGGPKPATQKEFER